LNGLLKGALARGLAVTVSVVLGKADVRIGSVIKSCDLAAKAERVRLEHAALVSLRQDGVTALDAASS
jgi:hypothetical protein